MTTLIQDLQAVLQPLAAGGCWYQVNTTQPAALPYLVYNRVTSAENNSLQGASQLQNTLLQVDVYSRSVSELVSLGAQVCTAMAAAAFTNVLLSATDFYEPDTKLRRTSYEYSVWASN